MKCQTTSKIRISVWLIIIVAVIESCVITPTAQISPDSNISERFPKATRTPDPLSITPSPTAPLGTTLNPITFGIVITESLEINEEALAQIISLLTAKSNQNISVEYYDSYDTLSFDIKDGAVHIAWLPPQILLPLEDQHFIEPALLSNHFGVYQYSTQIIANTDQGFQSYFDPDLNQSIEPAKIALSQFEDSRPCWVDQNSLSGYLLPAGIFTQNDIALQDGVITKSASSTIRALIIEDICDFGATYAGNGDPRTASSLEDIPDILSKIEIIWQSDPIIPNYAIVFHSDIPRSVRTELTKSFQSISDSADGNELFTSALGYEISGFKACEANTFEPLRQILEVLNTPANSELEE